MTLQQPHSWFAPFLWSAQPPPPLLSLLTSMILQPRSWYAFMCSSPSLHMMKRRPPRASSCWMMLSIFLYMPSRVAST